MTELGAIFLPQQPPGQLREVARVADDAGLEQLWLWEDCFWTGGVAAASAALACTARLKVGIGILPVPLRNVALSAMEIATLHQLFGDRPMVGIGHGVQDWMGQVGARVPSPMTLLREYATALRALLHGETVTTHGRYVRLDGVGLDRPPSPPPPLLIGATGPKTLRLAAELGDGTILGGGLSPDEVRTTVADIASTDGVRTPGASGTPAGVPGAPGGTSAASAAGVSLAPAETSAASAGASAAPTETSATWAGASGAPAGTSTAGAGAGAGAAGAPGGVSGGSAGGHQVIVFMAVATGPGAPERLARHQEKSGGAWPGVAGDAHAIAAVVRRMAEAGATAVVLDPTSEGPPPAQFVRFVAEEVRPLVS